MSSGIRSDLRDRLQKAHSAHTCLVAETPSEGRRLRYAQTRGDVVSPAPQVFALPELWESLNPREQERFRVRALARIHPSWTFSSYSAAAIHGLEISYKLFGQVHIACRRTSHTRDRSGITRHFVSNDQPEIVDGIRVTSIARTVFDCIRECSFPAGLAIADSALRIAKIDRSELCDNTNRMAAHHANGWRVTEILALADPRAESGGESVARAIILKEGFLPPDLQVSIQDPLDASNVYRVDFFWDLPSGPVAGELDGREKYRSPSMTHGRDTVDVFADERLRESRISGTGVRIMRFSYKDLMDTQRFHNLLTAYGIPSGFKPPRVSFI